MRLVAVAAAATLVGGCAQMSESAEPMVASCDELEVGDADAGLLLLTDGRSPALDRFAAELTRDAAATFASPRLGLDAEPGKVLVASYDELGEVTTIGRFSLAGVGPERVRRAADAERQATCLTEALSDLPQATGGHLLRALPTAIALAEPLAEGSVIVATGLGRADGDGFPVAATELGSVDDRSHVLDELERAGFVPPLDQADVGLVLLAPGEGVDSGLVAGAVGDFAADLCHRSGSERCEMQEVLP